ncbi:MAG: TIGR04283 family arsenosugar biosynthesis glycosyltransferase [Acidobacteria bacterium]|nr:TIGR04283 family arsenosugar biosynthesis glycosyltransferase [Acidobacteriota bacterium]
METAVEARSDGLNETPPAATSARAGALRLSVIIPARNEEDLIGDLIAQVRASGVAEIIVVDGSSRDRTRERARAAGARVIESPPGRGVQQNRGAAEASGDALLFLHADTRLPADFLDQIETLFASGVVCAGAFRLAVDAPGLAIRWVESMANWRSLYFQLPYGDQAIFVRRQTFREAGGFAAIPLMEDFELMRRLRKMGRIGLASSAVTTSARRWKQLGVWRATWSNQLCILAYLCGVSPERIAAWREARGR